MTSSNGARTAQLRQAAEDAFAEEIAALRTSDDRPRPPNWQMSPQAVVTYLMGGRLTEADWRLFTTLLRFDPVYHTRFKCNLRRLIDYPNLWNYTRDLFQVPGVAGTVRMDHIKKHYWGSHRTINPSGLVPIGPAIDYSAPHDRDRLAKAA